MMRATIKTDTEAKAGPKTDATRPLPDLGLILLRQREVCRKVGLSRTKVDSLELTGRFPQRIRLPGRIIAWRSDEIDQWIEEVAKNRIDIADQRYGKRNGRCTQQKSDVATA